MIISWPKDSIIGRKMEYSGKVSIIAYSKKGMEVAKKARGFFDGCSVAMFAPERLAGGEYLPEKDSEGDSYGKMFEGSDVIVFIGALGIAVRKIAPYVKDKRTDPAVLCLDENGRYVIPVLSGHIGGANELAGMIAGKLGSLAVITTATDINGKFSVDTWAEKNGYCISDMKMAKKVSAAILERDIPIYSDFQVGSDFPAGCYDIRAEQGKTIKEPGQFNIGICVTWQKKEPFAETLRIIPRIIHLGIGCRKGITQERVGHAIQDFLKENNIDARSVKGVYTIDIKSHEEGLLKFCGKMGWALVTYTAQELMNVQGEFSSSEFVRSITGADNVCERAAMADGGKLIAGKTVYDKVTLAAAEEDLTILF